MQSQIDPQGFFSGDRLFADVKAYADLGEHRTGTPVDLKTGAWLAQQLEGFGVKARLSAFRVPQFFLDRVSVVADGRAVEAFPLWYPRAGRARGRLIRVEPGVTAGVKGRVVLVKLPLTSLTPESGHIEILNPLIAAGAAGILALTESPSGELIALNAMRGADPWRVPIVIVGSREAASLPHDAGVEIAIEGRAEPAAEAREVIGAYGAGKRLFVVSTPYSGWFRCAAERGPGIAYWLSLARWASHRDSGARWIFVASSGHELNGAGVRHFLEHDAPGPPKIDVWLHLGAGIAAYDWRPTPDGPRRLDRAYAGRRLMTNHGAWMQLLARAFESVPDLKPQLTDRPPGELAEIVAKGYKCWGFAGGHAYHHAPGDLPDHTTSAALLDPVGQGILRALVELERA